MTETAKWKQYLGESAFDCLDKVVPVLKAECPFFNGCLFASLETVVSEEWKAFDRDYGFDLLVVKPDGAGADVIASRVQWMKTKSGQIKNGGIPYNTFSVRYARLTSATVAEYAKRAKDIRGGGIYPTWTMQAYLDERNGKLLSVAVVRTQPFYTECLIPGVEKHKPWVTDKPVGDGDDGRSGKGRMYTVLWEEIVFMGFVNPNDLWIYRSKDNG